MNEKEEVIFSICSIKGCFGMDIEIEDILGKKLTLCHSHADEFREVLSDIVLLEDKEWLSEWAHENLKEEVADKWD